MRINAASAAASGIPPFTNVMIVSPPSNAQRTKIAKAVKPCVMALPAGSLAVRAVSELSTKAQSGRMSRLRTEPRAIAIAEPTAARCGGVGFVDVMLVAHSRMLTDAVQRLGVSNFSRFDHGIGLR